MSGGPIAEQYQDDEPDVMAAIDIPSQEISAEAYYWLTRDAFVPSGTQGNGEAEHDSPSSF